MEGVELGGAEELESGRPFPLRRALGLALTLGLTLALVVAWTADARWESSSEQSIAAARLEARAAAAKGNARVTGMLMYGGSTMMSSPVGDSVRNDLRRQVSDAAMGAADEVLHALPAAPANARWHPGLAEAWEAARIEGLTLAAELRSVAGHYAPE